MRSTNVGVNLDLAQKRGRGIKILPDISTREYIDQKYDGLTDAEKRGILYPYCQIPMQMGVKA